MTTVDSRGVPLEDYMLDDRSSYVKLPTVPLPEGSEVLLGDEAWKAAMDIAGGAAGRPLIAVDVYPGGDVAAIAARIREVLPGAEVIDVEEAAAAELDVIDALIGRNLTDDRVFGVMSHFTVDEFYDADRLAALRRRVDERTGPTVLVGWGADLAADRRADALVLVDLARWEIQQRLRAGRHELARAQRAISMSCASTSAASSSNGAPPTGTSAPSSTGSTCSWTATPRSTPRARCAARTSARRWPARPPPRSASSPSSTPACGAGSG